MRPGAPGLRRFLGGALLVSCGLAVALGWAASASGAEKKIKPDPSGDFFKSNAVPRLVIEIAGTNLANLERDNRKYAKATVREGGTVYGEVGVHLKGAAGSFRGLDDRPALTLNFDKFREDQRFHGMDKIHLNNSVQDPSYMTEILCGEMFLAAGVPAARGGHALVRLNGRELGLYVLKEGFDKAFLKRHFKNAKGNLYDGGFLREITDPLDKISGEGVKDYADLKSLAAAAEERDPARRLARLDKVLDLDRFLSFIALEVITWHWDGYAMKRNNYRLYHQPDTGKVVFLPHGMDQMFWESHGPMFPNFEGLVAHAVVSTSEGRVRYYERVASLCTNVFDVEALTNRMNQLQARLRPVLKSIGNDAALNHDGSVDNLRRQIVERAANLAKQLQETEPGTLKFNPDGVAAITRQWRVEDNENSGALEKVSDAGKAALHIRAKSRQCIASWRTRVLLDPGQYRFEALARCAGVKATRDERGEGAGIRISGSQEPRPNQLGGDAAWTALAYEFSVTPGVEEIELVCELRASKGEVWFDAGSFKLVRKEKAKG